MAGKGEGKSTAYKAMQRLLKKSVSQTSSSELSKDRYVLLLELFFSDPQPRLLVDPASTRILEANPAACSFFSSTVTELKKRKVVDFVGGDEGQSFWGRIRVDSPTGGVDVVLHPKHAVRRDTRLFSQSFLMEDIPFLFLTLQDITAERQAKRVHSQLTQLSEAISHTNDLEDLILLLRDRLSSLFDTTNFYVALYDESSKLYSFPFFRNEVESCPPVSPQKKTLTDHVRKTGRSLMVDSSRMEELVEEGSVVLQGELSAIWLGVPLITSQGVIGIVGLQHYTDPNAYSEEDLEVLEIVASAVASTLERRHVMQALNRSEERFLTFVEQSAEGIWCLQLDAPVNTSLSVEEQVRLIAQQGRFIECNETFLRMYRLESRADVLGKRILDLPVEPISEKSNAPLSRFIKEGYRMTDGESWEIIPGGEERVFLNQLIGILKDDKLVQIWGAQRDITKRKKIESDLSIQKTHLERFIQNSPEGIVFVDPDDRIVSVNREFLRMFGFTEEELIGKENTLIVPKRLLTERADLAKAVVESESIALESVRQSKEGHEYEVSILGTPIRIEGKLIGTYWVYRDITLQKKSARLQTTLFHISEAASTSSDLDELLGIIHNEVGHLIDTTNFYVALYNPNRSAYRFAYFVDEKETLDRTKELELPNSLTDYVRKNGAALTGTVAEIRDLVKKKKIDVIGPMPESWLGVPLRAPEGTIGVVVVQSYNRKHAYSDQDMDLLEFVSGHIAVAIEHRRWQDALTTSEERYRTLFRQSPLGVVLFDKQFNVIDSNDRLLKIFKLKASQIIGLNLRDLDDKDVLKLADDAVKGKTERIDGEYSVFKTGVKRWLTGSVSPLYGSDQTIIGGMILIEDVTAQRETARELELQRAYAHHLFQDAPEAIVILDRNMKILRANGEFLRLFGFMSEEVTGKDIREMKMQPPQVDDRVSLREKIDNASHLSLESVRQNKQGEVFEVSVLGGPILMDGKAVAYYLIYRDISSRKHSELLQSVLYEIARTAAIGIESKALFRLVKNQLSRLIDINNFTIALYDRELDAYSFLYHIDDHVSFEPDKYYPMKDTLIDYVRRTSEPHLISEKGYKTLVQVGEINPQEFVPKSWLGVPLRVGEKVIGVLAVLSYQNAKAYSEKDLRLLEFVSGQIAGMIEYKRADMNLQASEARYRALFEQASVGVFLYDRNLKLIDLNTRFAEMVGVSREKLIGQDLTQLSDPRILPMLKAAFDGHADNYHGPYSANLNKKELFLSLRSSPLIGSDRKVKGGICIVLDETAQRRSEQRAEINRIYLEQLFERSPEAIILLDPRLRTIRVNEEFTNLFGYTQDDSLSRTVAEWIIPDGDEPGAVEHVKALKRIAKGELVRLDETICIRKDGTSVITSLLGSPIVIDGKVIALYAIYRDITAQKRAVEDLAQEKERLSVTLSSIGDGVITTDVGGRIVMMNHAAESITGWTNHAAAGKAFSGVFRTLDIDTRKPLPDPVQRVIESGVLEGWTRETLLQSHKGKDVILVGSAAPIHDLAGEVIGVVVVFRDVTEQRKLEEEMIKIERLESVGVLAGGIAHDFNNILSAVLGNISVARLIQNDMSLVQERLGEAEKAALRARDLTQQLLTFSRGGEPVRKSTNLEELVRESAGFALRGSNVLSEYEIEEKLWPADVDEGQVGRVIHNLVINADQAMPNGGRIYIRLRNKLVLEDSSLPLNPGRYVRLELQDEGVGIPAEYLQKIFDPFFTTKQRGSGLGLATSFSIVQKHGGFMSVKSYVGKGTTFVIYLPASGEKVKGELDTAGELFRGEGRILVMDDERAVQEVATLMLSELGFEVEVASDGASAIEKYLHARMDQRPFAVVIMDLTIPGGMGGEEAIVHLRKLDPNVKAVVSSGYSNDPIMSNFEQFGFAGVVAKPYRLQDLGAVLATILDGHT